MSTRSHNSTWSLNWMWPWYQSWSRSGLFPGRTSSLTSARPPASHRPSARTLSIFSSSLVKKSLTSAKTRFCRDRPRSSRRLLPTTSSPSSSYVNLLSPSPLRLPKLFNQAWFASASRHSKHSYPGSLLDTFFKPISSSKFWEIWSSQVVRESRLSNFLPKYLRFLWTTKKRNTKTCTKKRRASTSVSSSNKSRWWLRTGTWGTNTKLCTTLSTKATSNIFASRFVCPFLRLCNKTWRWLSKHATRWTRTKILSSLKGSLIQVSGIWFSAPT